MYTLFIDTHFKDINIILFKDNEVISEKLEKDVKNTSTRTMPLIKEVLDSINILPKDLNKIAVCIGPGSFTGTRIGVTIAKTLAYSLNIPISTLTSLDLIGLNLDKESYISIPENNGYFYCLYNELEKDNIKYLNDQEYDEFKSKNTVIEDIKLDNSRLIDFINKQEIKNPHLVNPIYVKQIEALK